MSLYDYASVIKITFDKPIVSVLDTQLGWALKTTRESITTPRASDMTYAPSRAFDGSIENNAAKFWQTRLALPQWIGFDLGVSKRLAKFRSYSYSAYRPRGYEILGSNDDTDWTLVTSGEFPNATQWNDITFSGASFRYWRLNLLSGWTAGRVYIFELEVYRELPTYNVAGWQVTAQEYNMMPAGVLGAKTYTVAKVTKSEDNLSVFLWLDLSNRMKNPIGLVTVNYSKALGNLEGAYSAYVEDFELTFTPENIQPVFNPHEQAFIEFGLILGSELLAVNHEYAMSDSEHIELGFAVASEIIHVDDIVE